ncbi:MAG: DUF3298 domain-containing protein [Muribaculaceae bacterium]|nr:DUF3298 domain-containing protein [Muribaculaceae bacterium]
MRTNVIFLSIPVALSAITGCTNDVPSSDTGNDMISFSTLSDTSYYELVDLTKEYGHPVYAVTSYSIVFPERVFNHDIRELQDSVISKTLWAKNPSLAEATEHFLESPSGIEESAVKEIPSSAVNYQNSGFLSTSGYVFRLTPVILTFRADYYRYYFHAAHGMYGSTFVNYHIPSGKVLTADDILVPGDKEEIISVIRDEAASKYKDSGMLDTEGIIHYRNFYISGQSITFVYQPYEAGPYALGMVEVTVYPHTIGNCLTPLGKKVLGIPD